MGDMFHETLNSECSGSFLRMPSRLPFSARVTSFPQYASDPSSAPLMRFERILFRPILLRRQTGQSRQKVDQDWNPH